MSERSPSARIVRLAAGESIELDVEFCDLVPANVATEGPSLRLKGRRVGPDGRPGELVRVFLDVEMAETPMRKSGVLRAPLPDLPRGETVLPVPLNRKRLTLRRVEGKNRVTWLEIRPREGVVALEDEEILGDYHWALASARNHYTGLLQSDGYPVGAAEIVTMANELFHERRRSRQERH